MVLKRMNKLKLETETVS